MNLAELIAVARLDTSDSPNLPNSALTKPVARVTDKSYEVTRNTLFVAIPGLTSDGHKYVAQAAQQGALAAVVERTIPCDIPQLKVFDSRRALADLSAAFYQHPARDLSVIGITGTNGKTTTTKMVHHILSQSQPVGLIGSLEVDFGDEALPAQATTPDAPALQYYLSEIRKRKRSWVVVEVSSHGLQLHRTAGIPFSIAGITNITADHLDFHGTMDNYISAKSQLFSHLKPGGIGFYNADDALSERAARAGNETLFSFGQDPTSDIQFTASGKNHIRLGFSKSFQRYFALTRSVVDIELSLFGIHNLYNAALAVGISLAAGASLPQVIGGLSTFKGVARRLEILHKGSYMVIDDYGHNPSGIGYAIQAVSELEPKRLLVVHALRGNRGYLVNKANGEVLRNELSRLSCPVRLWITNSQDMVGPEDRVSDQEEAAAMWVLTEAPFVVKHTTHLTDAVTETLRQARDGDVVLMLGAQGMDRAREIISNIVVPAF